MGLQPADVALGHDGQRRARRSACSPRASRSTRGRWPAIAAFGLLLSTVTRNSAASVVGTLMWALLMQLLGVLPGTEAIRPYLLGDAVRRLARLPAHARRLGAGRARALGLRALRRASRSSPATSSSCAATSPANSSGALTPLQDSRAARSSRRCKTPCGYARRVSIVSDVKERGFEAVREWAVKLDGVEPARAVADAGRAAARGAAAARGPRAPLARGAAARGHHARGGAGRHARAALARARHRRRLRAAQPDLDARHVRRPRAGRGRAPHRRLHAAARRRADRRCRRGARASTRCGRSAGRRRSAGSPTSNASTRSSAPATTT